MNKSFLIVITIIVCMCLSVSSWGQTTVFSDNFSSDQSATWTTTGTIGSGSWSVSRSGNDWGARRNTSPAHLELTNDASATANLDGWIFANVSTSSFSSPYNTTLSSNTGIITWTFNLRQIRTDPAGFGSGSYGVAFILGGTSTTTNNTGNGYAVVFGQSGTTDPVRLAKYTGGLGGTITNIITSNTVGLTDFGAEYISVKVTYNPSTNTWELFLRNDGASAFTDPDSGTLTSQGTAIDNTYTGSVLSYMGAHWQGSIGATQTAFIDNVKVTVETSSGTILETSNPAATAGDVFIGSNTVAYIFSLDGSSSPGTLDELTINSTHTSGDVASFELMWWDNDMQTATAGLGGIYSVAGSGDYTFYGINENITGLQYYCIVVTAEWGAVIGNTIRINAIDAADITFSSGTVSGSGYAGGTQTIIGPVINVSETNLYDFNYIEGAGPSAEQSFSVSGFNLIDDITLTAGPNFELSLTSGSGFTTPLTITESSGNVTSTTVYVRLKSGLAAATYFNENTNITSDYAVTKTVECDGSVLLAGACASDLIISEYGEGSGNNKYIEIYNGTGASVDLSHYILKQSYNGAGWDPDPNSVYNKPLSGILANEDVFIIAASDANATILAVTDMALTYDAVAQGGKVIFFTGNDAMGLFKGSVLIDVFGDPSSSLTIPVAGFSTYGQDHTIVRKDNIFDGNTDWASSAGTNTTDSEWTGYAQDNWTYIGSHSMLCTPTLTVSETNLSGFYYYFGNGPSTELSFTITGDNLLDDITIEAPSDYEISETSGSGFGTSVTLNTINGEVAETTIFARLKSGLNLGTYSNENIVISSTGVSNDTVKCNGDVLLPPVTGLDVGCTSGSTATVSWTAPAGTFDGVIIAIRNSINPPHTISDGTNPALLNANTTFESGTQFGGTTPYSYVVYKGTGTSVTIDGLTAGQDYRIKAYTYYGTDWIDDSDCPTTSITNLGLPEVTSVNKLNGNQQGEISWNSPSSFCFEEIMIVCTQGSPVTALPSGDGSSYIANSVFSSGTEISSGEYVVYKGTGTGEIITGLTNGLTYYCKIFVRSSTQWSEGIQVILNPDEVTFLEYGDLAIIAVNTNGTVGDEFCFVSFVDISAGTTIDFTDNGYERISAGLWADSEGFLSFTRLNSDVSAGKVITFECIGNVGTPILGSNVNVYLDGVLDNSNWSTSSSGSGSGFNFNSDDQIWVMQGGTWSDPPGTHNATYSGTVLYGWTAIGWFSTANYNSTAGSTIYPGCECATTNVSGLINNSKVKYTGEITAANRTEWIGRINDPSNWTGWSENDDYDTGTPLYKQNGATFSIVAGDLTAGKWAGYKSSGWCDCANWFGLKVPESTTNVQIPAHVEDRYDLVLCADADSLAVCNNLIINGNIYNVAGASLDVFGNFEIDGGKVFFNTNQLEINIAGNITIDEADSLLTNTADIFLNGTGNQLIEIEGTSIETLTANSITFNGGGTKTISDNIDIAENLVVDNCILSVVSAGVSIDIDGNLSLQNSGSMNDNCKSNLDITLSNNTSQVISGSGNEIKARIITADKNNSNLSLSTTGGSTNLFIGENGYFNMTGTSVFTDNGNIIQTDDDLFLGGDAATNYNLSGIIRYTGTNVSGLMLLADNSGSGAINAELSTLNVQGGDLEIMPATGGSTIVIKDDYLVENSATVDANDNNLTIGGDYYVSADASFDATNITVSFNGVADQNLSANNDYETFGTLVINKTGGSLLLDDNIESNLLNLTSGLITTGTNYVFVSNSTPANIINYSTISYINGNLRRAVNASGNYDLPVGNATNFELANIDLNSSTGLTHLDVSFGAAGTPIDISGLGLMVNATLVETLLDAGIWTITPNAGMSAVNYDIGLSMRGATNAGTDPEQHTIVKRINSSSDWTLQGNHNNTSQSISSGVVYAYRSNINAFSDFAIAKNNTNTLPVDLISFSLDCSSDAVEINWATASELNNDFFEIQKSNDGNIWHFIGTVKGSGNSSFLNHYSFIDKQNGTNAYYRLRQVDFDGKFEYSPVIYSNCNERFDVNIIVYPNPVYDYLNVMIENWQSEKINWEVANTTGQIVCKGSFENSDSYSVKQINVSELKPGIYVLRFIDNNDMIIRKIDKK